MKNFRFKQLIIGVLVGLLLGGGLVFAATKWSDFTLLSAGNIADGDDFLLRDVSDTTLAATGTQKRFSWASFKTDLGSAGFYENADDLVIGSGGDPADAGTIRLKNADSIAWEADPTGTDIVGISVDSSEVIQIASSGASGVTITPALTCSSTISGGIVVTQVSSMPYAVTSAQVKGGWLVVTAVGDVDLPASPSIGDVIYIEQGDASEVISVAVGNASHDILLSGVLLGVDNEIDSPGGAGDRGSYIQLIYTETNLWRVKAREGVWVDGGPVD